MRPETTRGRLFPEPESASRTPFQRDRDRIIHSAAFRRLQYKTQVFVYHEGDHYRTRLTHSLEVAQIARSMARTLGLDTDLAEAVALAHDLGHPPFGHAGEEALREAMEPFGGFDHNEQTLRLVTELERRYAAFDGLNLTWETLEGILKHNGPLLRAGDPIDQLPAQIRLYLARHDLKPAAPPTLEAQLAAISDDIAYNNHDIDDGLRAGLFTVDSLMAVPLVGPTFRDLLDTYPGLEPTRLIHEAVRRLIGQMIRDVVSQTRAEIAARGLTTQADVHAQPGLVVGFSPAMAADCRALKDFLWTNMYRHYRVNRSTSKARRIVRDLFGLFLSEPQILPTEWQARTTGSATPATAHVVCDYIAGMTDRFAINEHRRLFDLSVDF
ncbi:MAG: deoxyguanosinetriphosphate triphosphohydrolase [Pseudomonadota bacterium]